MSAVADNYSKLQELGVEVFSVSVDSHFVHKMWNDHELVKMVEGGVPFPMVSDQAGNVGRAYGVWDEAQGIELRGRFIIDPDGVIQAMEVLTPPVGRKLAETVRQVQAFQLVRQSQGHRGHAGRVGAGSAHAEARPGPRGQRLEGLEAQHGEVVFLVVAVIVAVLTPGSAAAATTAEDGATVWGVVLAPDGSRLPGAVVTLVRHGGGEARVVAGALGVYRASGLAAGDLGPDGGEPGLLGRRGWRGYGSLAGRVAPAGRPH